MQHYTCGFMFDRGGNVVLLLKKKPDWQSGLLNGVGGKLEAGETPSQCMAREWSEETGDASHHDWDHFISIGGKDSVVHFFRVTVDEFPLFPATTDVGEIIVIIPAATIERRNFVPNLRWLIPLARERDFQVVAPLAARFTADSVEQERLAIEISAKICNGARPDAIQVLEWAEALYRAEMGSSV